MQLSNYDNKTRFVFDTAGTYFVNMFYNAVYLQASQMFKDGKYSSLTDAYRANVLNYMSGIKRNKETYHLIVSQLHTYCHQYGVVHSMLIEDFEDAIISKFIPAEYFSALTGDDKDGLMQEIISNTIQRFAEHVLTPSVLRTIIDDRKNRNHIDSLQSHIVDLFVLNREEIVSKLVNQNIKDTTRNSNSVDHDVFNKLKAVCVTETQRRTKAEEDRQRLMMILQKMGSKIEKLSAELAATNGAINCDRCPQLSRELQNKTDVANRIDNEMQELRHELKSANKSECISCIQYKNEIDDLHDQIRELRNNANMMRDMGMTPTLPLDNIEERSPRYEERSISEKTNSQDRRPSITIDDDYGYPSNSVSDSE